MSAEATNILRRFVRVAAQLDPTDLRYFTLSARTLHPHDMRLLAAEAHEHAIRNKRGGEPVIIRAGDPPRPHQPTPVSELRGLARSIIRYGGPDAVRRDADPQLVEAVNSIGWTL